MSINPMATNEISKLKELKTDTPLSIRQAKVPCQSAIPANIFTASLTELALKNTQAKDTSKNVSNQFENLKIGDKLAQRFEN